MQSIEFLKEFEEIHEQILDLICELDSHREWVSQYSIDSLAALYDASTRLKTSLSFDLTNAISNEADKFISESNQD